MHGLNANGAAPQALSIEAVKAAGHDKMPQPGDPHASGTVYLATADAEGNRVSFIQRNYHGFGSGVVLPDSGIALQNRGALWRNRAANGFAYCCVLRGERGGKGIWFLPALQ